MSESASLADHISRQSEDILTHWRASVERDDDLTAAARLPRVEFDDHVPELLDRLSDRLRGTPVDPDRVARQHGGHRWRQGYNIAQVVTELGHLRAILCRATADFARQRDWDLLRFEAALVALNDVLDEMIGESVRQFQADGQRAGRKALADVKSRQRSIEEASAAAKAERSKLRAILRTLPVAVWVLDPDGTIRGTNEVAEQIQGFKTNPDDSLPNVHQLGPEYRIFRPDGAPYPIGELPGVRALSGEVVTQEELLWLAEDGDPRTIAVNAGPLTDPSGAVIGAVAVGVDLTSRKRLETDLKRARATAEETSRHKTRLVSALSHDVRTPLNSVVLAAQLLEANLSGPVDPEVKECLRTIRHSVKNVLDLLNDLLDLTKIDAGAASAAVSRFAIGPMLVECLASIEPQAKVKGLEVGLDPGPLAGLDLETDRPKLKQVLCNLLSNALRYTHEGSMRLIGGLDADRLLLSVTDTGVGIAEIDQSRIFDEFAVLEQPGRQVGEGTGLGLAICRRLAAILGGEIRLVSVPGVGSTFTLALPASMLVSASTPARLERGAGSSGATGSILVAEDHADSRQTLGRVLRRMGFRVLEAADGRAAVEIARHEAAELRAVLMDVNMPGMDGVDATLAIRADPMLKHVLIFALTGDVTTANQNRIARAGVDGFLEKPVTWEALRDALDPVVEPEGSTV